MSQFLTEPLISAQVPPGWGGIGQMGTPGAPASAYGQGPSQGPVDTESRVPVINLKDGTRLAGDDAPRRTELDRWLREHPGFVADTGAFIPVSTPPRLPIRPGPRGARLTYCLKKGVRLTKHLFSNTFQWTQISEEMTSSGAIPNETLSHLG